MSEHDLWLKALEVIKQQREAREAAAAWKAAQRKAVKRWRQVQEIKDLMRP